MKTRYFITTVLITLILTLGYTAAAEGLMLTPPTDSQKYKPLTAVTTTVYVVGSKNTYMACKVDIPLENIKSAYLFINQNFAYNSKFDVKNLSKGIEIKKDYITNGYIVFNMKDYKGVVENKYPNKVTIGIQKTDNTMVFSNTVLLTIASGDMTYEKEVKDEKIVYYIKEGFLPIDPSTISVKSDGKDIPYYFNQYKKSVTLLLAPTDNGSNVVSVDFKVKDLRGKSAIANDSFKLNNLVSNAQNGFTRIQLAKYIYDLAGYEPVKTVFNFKDIDYIPYEGRLIVSTLKEHNIMMEDSLGGQYSFNPNQRVTQKILANAISKLVGRELYKPEDPNAYVSIDEAIKVLLNALAEFK